MKSLLIVLSLFATMTTFGSDFTTSERAQLYTVKMMLEIQLDNVREAKNLAKENSKKYSELGRFSFKQKRYLRAQHCANIKSVIGTNMLMVAVSLEQASEALNKVEVSDENGLTFQENFMAYISAAREASNKCKNVEESAKVITNSYANLKLASDILINAIPELIEE